MSIHWLSYYKQVLVHLIKCKDNLIVRIALVHTLVRWYHLFFTNWNSSFNLVIHKLWYEYMFNNNNNNNNLYLAICKIELYMCMDQTRGTKPTSKSSILPCCNTIITVLCIFTIQANILLSFNLQRGVYRSFFYVTGYCGNTNRSTHV